LCCTANSECLRKRDRITPLAAGIEQSLHAAGLRRFSRHRKLNHRWHQSS
jgi:hypothetical protein